MSENTIGIGAIKIACFQTTPGKEGLVKSDLEQACTNLATIKDFAIFKGLGTFDIILVYLTDNFSQSLREYGPIKNIIKSNTLLCFSFANKKPKAIFDSIKKKVFTSFCMLKINPGARNDFPNIDPALRDLLQKNRSLSFLGSLGWNENIVLVSTDTIQEINNYISRFVTLNYIDRRDVSISATLKILTFIGINYRYLPDYTNIKCGYNKILARLNETAGINLPVESSSESIEILPSISIAARSNWSSPGLMDTPKS